LIDQTDVAFVPQERTYTYYPDGDSNDPLVISVGTSVHSEYSVYTNLSGDYTSPTPIGNTWPVGQENTVTWYYEAPRTLFDIPTEPKGNPLTDYTCDDAKTKSQCSEIMATWFSELNCEIANSDYGGCSGLMEM
jgi:hypothetical protein